MKPDKAAVVCGALILGMWCACSVSFAADKAGARPPLKITSRVDKMRAGVGERILYTVRARMRDTLEVEPVTPAKTLGDFEVNDFSQNTSRLFGWKNVTLRYRISVYEPGTHTLPGVAIRYRMPKDKQWQEARSAQQQIDVQSLVPGLGPEVDIRDIKGPIGLQGHVPWWLLPVFLVIVTAGYLVYRWAGGKRLEEEQESLRRADEIAYEQLEALKNKGLIRRGRIKEYYSELSLIVRHYLENRFTLRAPEMTTEEFLVYVRDYAVLQPGHKQVLKDFLLSCDLVKFAKYLPPVQDSEFSFEAVKRFIDETRQVEDTADKNNGRQNFVAP